MRNYDELEPIELFFILKVEEKAFLSAVEEICLTVTLCSPAVEVIVKSECSRGYLFEPIYV